MGGARAGRVWRGFWYIADGGSNEVVPYSGFPASA